MAERQLNHYTALAFTEAFWSQPGDRRRAFLGETFAPTLADLAPRTFLYALYPARPEADLLLWSALPADDPAAAGEFFLRHAAATARWRPHLRPVDALWGFTRPSVYYRGKSAQRLDPLESPDRRPYLVIYPFEKTAGWYLLDREERQAMMNEHITVGKQYPEITQLLLYCTGLADQEFVVVYETDDLAHFSALVTDLRGTQGRAYTLRDTPIYTATYRPADALLPTWA